VYALYLRTRCAIPIILFIIIIIISLRNFPAENDEEEDEIDDNNNIIVKYYYIQYTYIYILRAKAKHTVHILNTAHHIISGTMTAI